MAILRDSTPTQKSDRPTEPPPPHIDDKAAAQFLNAKVTTLRKWRCRGVGPRWRKFGHMVRYSRADLERWAADMERSSTSDGEISS